MTCRAERHGLGTRRFVLLPYDAVRREILAVFGLSNPVGVEK